MKRTTGFIVFALIVAGVLASQAISQQDQPKPAPAPQIQPPSAESPHAIARDPAMLRQGRLERIKEGLGVTDDQWKAMEPKITKVQMIQMQQQRRMLSMSGRRPMLQPGSDPATADMSTKASDLQKLLDDKESKPEAIKAALQAYREAREKSKKELVDAQKDLASSCNERQQAYLVLSGILE